MGFWANGFDVTGIDSNALAARTYTANLGSATCSDIRALAKLPKADVIIAGPPCQPWSRAGKRLCETDDRDGLSMTMHALRAVLPPVVVVENVPDMARQGKRKHLDQFQADLKDLGYAVGEHVLNAADYGVPQNRRRIFVTGVLGDKPLAVPEPLQLRVTVRQAIPGRCEREALGSHIVSDTMNAYIERYERASGCRIPRDVNPDSPSRTLTVRNLCGATGDMLRLRLPDGRRRTLTVQEAARIQSFPDWFKFHGNDRNKFEQIGNAVPPLLSLAVADVVKRTLLS